MAHAPLTALASVLIFAMSGCAAAESGPRHETIPARVSSKCTWYHGRIAKVERVGGRGGMVVTCTYMGNWFTDVDAYLVVSDGHFADFQSHREALEYARNWEQADRRQMASDDTVTRRFNEAQTVARRKCAAPYTQTRVDYDSTRAIITCRFVRSDGSVDMNRKRVYVTDLP